VYIKRTPLGITAWLKLEPFQKKSNLELLRNQIAEVRAIKKRLNIEPLNNKTTEAITTP
jgi:hypothetical protein